MDYSLLVGIHDCTIPLPVEDENAEDWGDEDGNGYISSDEVVEPVSPQGRMYPGTGFIFHAGISVEITYV